MKRVLVLCGIFLAAPAVAETPNQAAQREARSFFSPCPPAGQPLHDLCKVNQQNFLENYVMAKSGDAYQMRDIAFRFDSDPYPDPLLPDGHQIGIRRDRRQACAWLVTAFTASPPGSRDATAAADRYTRKCTPVLSPNELAAADERAEVLLRELRTNPAVPAD